MEALVAKLAGRHRPRMDRALLRGAAGRRAGARSSTRISLLVVFLCLAALYESWSIPFVGHAGGAARRGGRGAGCHPPRIPSNDVYFQVGLLTTIGLVGQERHPDRGVRQAIGIRSGEGPGGGDAQAARMRLRPILMTSLAFILGVLAARHRQRAPAPAAQNAIGTGVLGGMLSATVLGILFVPLFFVWSSGGAGGLGEGRPRPDQRGRPANPAVPAPGPRRRRAR